MKKDRLMRRYLTDKKSTKRWKLYHGDKGRDHNFDVAFGLKPLNASPHMYHKRKGCECRKCSAAKQDIKLKSNEAARTEVKKLKKII